MTAARTRLRKGTRSGGWKVITARLSDNRGTPAALCLCMGCKRATTLVGYDVLLAGTGQGCARCTAAAQGGPR